MKQRILFAAVVFTGVLASCGPDSNTMVNTPFPPGSDGTGGAGAGNGGGNGDQGGGSGGGFDMTDTGSGVPCEVATAS